MKEYNMTEYSGMQSIDDYKNVCLQFGNLTLFVAAVPFLPFLACLKNFIEIRVDGWKLVNGFRCVILVHCSTLHCTALHSLFMLLSLLLLCSLSLS